MQLHVSNTPAPEGGAKKAKRRPCRVYLDPDRLEWMAVAGVSTAVLYLGSQLGLAAQLGTQGLAAQLRAVLGNTYALLYMAVMLAFGAAAMWPAKRWGALCLCAPAAVYLGMTVYRLVQPVTVAAALLYAFVQGADVARAAGPLVPPLLLVLAPYLLQLAVLVSLALLLFGHGSRVVHGVLCLLWPVASSANTLVYMDGSLLANAPKLMLMLAFFAAAYLLAMPALYGKRVPACWLPRLQAAEKASLRTRRQTLAAAMDAVKTGAPADQPLPDEENAAGQAAADSEQTTADANQASADTEQVAADAEQAGADTEQATADTDQAAADTDQAAADTDQAAADANQAPADAEQAAADTDQAAADANQAAADAEQVIADAEQAAADTDQVTADADQAAADTNQATAADTQQPAASAPAAQNAAGPAEPPAAGPSAKADPADTPAPAAPGAPLQK